MRKPYRDNKSRSRRSRIGARSSPLLLAVLALPAAASAANLSINPNFDSSITGDPNAAAIEGAINNAIGTVEALYTPNNVSLAIDFSYKPAGPGNLLSTSQFVYGYTYSDYTKALSADSTANPLNTDLATAVAHLADGNNSTGAGGMVVTFGQALLLANYGLSSPTFFGNAAVNINSDQTFDFTRPVPPSDFDLIGGLEHELNEVLGGGGGGSMLPASLDPNCAVNPSFFCGKFGSIDLYRYSAPGTPSFTLDPAATPYLSLDGGVTKLAGLNQILGGDFGDFAPPGTGPGQLIQNAFNSTGQDEDYTTASPEFAMIRGVGWNSAAVPPPPVPEPGTLTLLAGWLLGLGALRHRRRS